MLDKLCANAIEFGRPDRPVVVRIERAGDAVVLSVANEGPPLPEVAARAAVRLDGVGARGRAARRARAPRPPGLYIVRLIAQAHRGTVRADNRADGGGVVVAVTLPLPLS